MLASLALASLLPILAAAVPCVQFDTQWNLYAFGGSQDVNLGKSSSWAQPSVTPLTTTGRPPWTGTNTQCLLSQYNNAMYVVGADASDNSKIYVYSFGSNSWSTQSTSSAPSAPSTRSSSILDHDTNVLFTYSNGGLSQLDMSSVMSTATSSALAWEAVSAPTWASGSSGVTAAQASNHILYFGAPNTSAGSAQIFVIHYAYWQPTAQAFPARSGSSFPAATGQAVSFPIDGDGVPTQIAFIPSDFSSTYVVNHWTNPSSYASTDGSPYSSNLINTTSTLPAPSTKDASAAYAASPSSLVQVTTSGEINYIANAVASGTAVSGASWTKMSYSLTGGSGSSSGNSSSSSASAASGTGSAAASSGTGSASGSRSSTASASGGSAAAASSSRAAAMGTVVQGNMGVIGGVAMLAVAGVAGIGLLL